MIELKPDAKLVQFGKCTNGTLVSATDSDGRNHCGLRVTIPGKNGAPDQPALADLSQDKDAVRAWLMPAKTILGRPTIGVDDLVVNYGVGWSIHVDAKNWRWRGSEKAIYGGDDASDSGALLMLPEAGQFRIVVSCLEGGNALLNLNDWQVRCGERVTAAASAKWELRLHGEEQAIVWPAST